MKNIILILAAAALIAGCGKVEDEYYPSATTGAEEVPLPEFSTDQWKANAAQTTDNFIAKFWNENNQCFDMVTGAQSGFQYWPQAHAMDVIIDAYIRTGDAKYKAYYDKWFEGVKAGNQSVGGYGAPGGGANYRNDFIDDMAWISLTMLRMYETTQDEKYLAKAEEIYSQYMLIEWTQSCGGGLKWKHSEGANSNKNACTNGPAAIIGARLSGYFKAKGDNDKAAYYLEQAKAIYGWLRATLYNPVTGMLSDGFTDPQTIQSYSLSYTVGTALGAAHELYTLTQDANYIDDAVKMANHATTIGCIDTNTGCLRDEGAGNADGGLFKGIFIRYFVKLINDDSAPVSGEKRKQFYNFVQFNAATAWAKGIVTDANAETAFLFNANWAATATLDNCTGLQGNVSGCTLIEGMAAVKTVQ